MRHATPSFVPGGAASRLLLAGCALFASGASGCGAPPQEVAGPADASGRRAGLTVAVDPGKAGETIVVNANAARTLVGHFRAGDRVRIDVLDTQWTPEPGPALHDARGVPGERCVSTPGSPCIGGDAPLLGLILLAATAVPDDANRDSTCMSVQRLHVPNGAEFTVPIDSEIALGPNDREDGLENNAGSIEVEVERSAGKKNPVTERAQVSVSALSSATLAGRFRAGEYVRLTVKSGRWRNDPGSRFVDASGYADQPCAAAGHVCIGGDGKPLMGLILMMSCFSITDRMMPLQRIDRTFIPEGIEVVLEHDADLFLAPNDREDALANNAGFARVRVRVLGR